MEIWLRRLGMPLILACACAALTPVAPEADARPAAREVPTATSAEAYRQRASAGFSDDEIARLFGSAGDDVSFSVRDRKTGNTYTYNPSLRNSTGSIVKVLVLATVVREQRSSGRELSAGQKSLASRMIRYSDNEATTALFRQVGGRAALQRMARDLGMTRTEVSSVWGTTTTSAADQRLLIDRLVDGTPHLTKRDRDYILGLMRDVDPEQRWGVGAVPRGQSVAVKNGWVPIEPRGWRINSVGSISGSGRDYTLAILSYDNGSMETGVQRVRKVSELVWSTLGATASTQVPQSPSPGTPGRPYWVRPGGAVAPLPFT